MPAAADQVTNARQYVVHLYGNTAVLNFLTDLEQYREKTIVNQQRRTETWRKQAGRWLLIAAQWDNTPVTFYETGSRGQLSFQRLRRKI